LKFKYRERLVTNMHYLIVRFSAYHLLEYIFHNMVVAFIRNNSTVVAHLKAGHKTSKNPIRGLPGLVLYKG